MQTPNALFKTVEKLVFIGGDYTTANGANMYIGQFDPEHIEIDVSRQLLTKDDIDELVGLLNKILEIKYSKKEKMK